MTELSIASMVTFEMDMPCNCGPCSRQTLMKGWREHELEVNSTQAPAFVLVESVAQAVRQRWVFFGADLLDDAVMTKPTGWMKSHVKKHGLHDPGSYWCCSGRVTAKEIAENANEDIDGA